MNEKNELFAKIISFGLDKKIINGEVFRHLGIDAAKVGEWAAGNELPDEKDMAVLIMHIDGLVQRYRMHHMQIASELQTNVDLFYDTK